MPSPKVLELAKCIIQERYCIEAIMKRYRDGIKTCYCLVRQPKQNRGRGPYTHCISMSTIEARLKEMLNE